MKPFLSFLVILLLFQSLFLGSLVKFELPDMYADKWDVTLIQRQIVLDPFLMPGKEGLNQIIQNKNEWLPFHFNKTFMLRNTSALPMVSEFLFKPGTKHTKTTVPVFIMNGILRI